MPSSTRKKLKGYLAIKKALPYNITMGKNTEIKKATTDIVPEYKYSPQCKCCTAESPEGKKLRNEIDALYLAGETTKGIEKWLAEQGVFVHYKNIGAHIRKHSPHIAIAKRMKVRDGEKYAKRLIDKMVDAESALQGIINIGTGKIVMGEIDVDGKLLMEAIKEQGRRRISSSLDKIFEKMERRTVEAEIVKNKDAN